MRGTGRRKRASRIEITEEMISAGAEVLSAHDGWAFGGGSARAVALEMILDVPCKFVAEKLMKFHSDAVNLLKVTV